MLMLGALIGAGASLIGGALSRKSSKAAQASNQMFSQQQFEDSLEHQNLWNQRNLDFATRQFESGIQTRVKDARAAGLHPLFALGGAGGGGSPSFSTGGHPVAGQHRTGSAVGTGIARAGRALGAAISGRSLVQAELAERRARTDLLEAQENEINSRIKRAEQSANSTRAPEGDWNQPAGQVRITPLPGHRLRGRSTAPPSWKRPIEAHKNQSIPRYIEQVGPKGRRRGLNPALGLDELGQIFDAIDPYYQNWGSHLRKHLNSRWGPNPFTHPRAYYHYWKQRMRRNRR